MSDRHSLFRRVVLVCMGMAFFTGCARFETVSHGPVKYIDASPVSERQAISVPVMVQNEAPPDEYLLGPNDSLSIAIENSADVTAKPGNIQPHKIDNNGFIVMPMAGKVKVGGLTVVQAQERIEAALRKYYKEPAVSVEIVQPKSQPIYLMGQFKVPGVYYMEGPLTLIQGMALGHGPDASANLRGARLIRKNKIVPIDVYDVLIKGELRQNVWLKAGDTIYIPDAKSEPVFVFGAVKNPGMVPMVNGQLSLLQALSITGFGDLSYDHNIRIIRSLSTTRGELIVVDYTRIMKGETMPFMLMEGDIVFVPSSTISNWNTALKEILPTLQAFGDILNPFVQMKFLLDRNN
jgi:polysaccharide export outer membrane protein